MKKKDAARIYVCSHLDGIRRMDNTKPSWPDVLNAVRSCKGTHGPDGWLAEELRYMPAEAVQCFMALTHQWERLGKVPDEMTAARQVNLIKPGKTTVGPDGVTRLSASQTRPISIFSV